MIYLLLLILNRIKTELNIYLLLLNLFVYYVRSNHVYSTVKIIVEV